MAVGFIRCLDTNGDDVAATGGRFKRMSASDSGMTIWQRCNCEEENDLSQMQQVENLVSSFHDLPSYEKGVAIP